MSFTYGFYNSVNHDRVYDAVQLSQLFDGLIADGVYETQGDKFRVLAGTGMTVTVGTGRAWFHHTWSLNDSLLPLTIDDSDLVLPRIDAVALEIDHSNAVRKNTIKIVKGLPAETPQKPEMADEETLHQYPLAYVTIAAGATSITQASIENAVGTSECPFVTGIIEVMNIDMLVSQWTAQWNEYIVGTENDFDEWIAVQKAWMSDQRTWMLEKEQEYLAWASGFESSSEAAFNEWFQHLHNELDEHQAAHLQNQIDTIHDDLEQTIDDARQEFEDMLEITNEEVGLDSSHVEFNADGSITENFTNKTKVTVFNNDGSITETVTDSHFGTVIFTRHTVFNADGSIDTTVTKGGNS